MSTTVLSTVHLLSRGLIVLMAVFPAAACSQETSELPPRVAALREELSRERDAPGRRELLEKKTEALRGVAEMSEAFLLREWLERKQDGEVPPDVKVRAALAGRLEKAIREELAGDDATRKAAAATIVGTLAAPPAGYGSECPDVLVQLLRNLVPDLVTLTRDADAMARAAAARALGRVGTSPEKSVPALATLLADRDITVRRAAARALAYHGGDRGPEPLALPHFWDRTREEVRAAFAAVPSCGRQGTRGPGRRGAPCLSGGHPSSG
jgi:hypothetical protein